MNLISISDEYKYHFNRQTLSQIFKNSYLKTEHIRVIKSKLLKIFEYMQYLKININYVNYDKQNKKLFLSKDVDLISFLNIEQDKNKTLITITLFNWLKWVHHYSLSRIKYINKNVLNLPYNLLGLFTYIDFNKWEIKNKWLNISTSDIWTMLWRVNTNKNKSVIKYRYNNILKKVLKYFDKKITISKETKYIDKIRLIQQA